MYNFVFLQIYQEYHYLYENPLLACWCTGWWHVSHTNVKNKDTALALWTSLDVLPPSGQKSIPAALQSNWSSVV